MPVFVTRDPRIIRAVATDTGDKPGQFDRDTMPSTGIARATGPDSLLYTNGAEWRNQKKLATPPFARTTLFQPEQFHEFEHTFRRTVSQRLDLVRARIAENNGAPFRVALEPEIKAIMLELLVNNFFGADVPYDRIREHYVPSIEGVIDHIVRDTVVNKVGCPLHRMPSIFPGIASAKKAMAGFYDLTDRSICPRHDSGGKGLWRQFRSDAPDEALKANVRVFIAGALEATTSYAAWAISHLARNPAAQEKVYQEVKDIDDYTPDTLARLTCLANALDETLRLTPALYFLPRRATTDFTIDLGEGQTFIIPKHTHILLDVWHANRHEDHWGIAATGFPASEFHPERWAALAERDRANFMHFGFGHGPRFCPGKNLGQLEVALVVGACIKLFHLTAVNPSTDARVGVSTKPADGALVELQIREPTAPSSSHPAPQPTAPQGVEA
jgi:cytochrome P450